MPDEKGCIDFILQLDFCDIFDNSKTKSSSNSIGLLKNISNVLNPIFINFLKDDSVVSGYKQAVDIPILI